MPDPDEMRRGIQCNIRLGIEDQDFIEMCEITHRQRAHTLHVILRLFMKDGLKAASDKLNAGLWDLDEDKRREEAKRIVDRALEEADQAARGRKKRGNRRA